MAPTPPGVGAIFRPCGRCDVENAAALYTVLERISDNPVVSLNRAVAVAMVHGAAAGLELLAALDGDARLRGHHRLHAVRAHLLERAGDREGALHHYRAAAERTASLPERDYLVLRAARVAAGQATPSMDGR
jgi:predicted RNA polymerase sigma factor